MYAKGLCKDAKSTKHTQPFTGERGFGKDAEIERPKALQDAKPTKRSYRDREFALHIENHTFSTNLSSIKPS